MTKCAGCGEPLEHIAAIRVYHGGCDPKGRVEMLEWVLRELAETRPDSARHDVSAMADAVNEIARAALDYKPVQLGGPVRKGEGRVSKYADEPMDHDTLKRAKALGPDAARVVKAYLRLEGALHRIEEWPEHEDHYPLAERYACFRDVASHAIQGGQPGEFTIKPARE